MILAALAKQLEQLVEQKGRTVGPASCLKPPRSNTWARPPMASRLSTSVTDYPFARMRSAAAIPPKPAPITRTSLWPADPALACGAAIS